MNRDYEVISAFIDSEPFDLAELASALADSDGRRLLIDLVALRQLVQVSERATGATAIGRRGSIVTRLTLVAAGLAALAFTGGYAAGGGLGSATPAAPAPTIVVETTSSWQDVTDPGVQR